MVALYVPGATSHLHQVPLVRQLFLLEDKNDEECVIALPDEHHSSKQIFSLGGLTTVTVHLDRAKQTRWRTNQRAHVPPQRSVAALLASSHKALSLSKSH
jgi:hypothetical protein